MDATKREKKEPKPAKKAARKTGRKAGKKIGTLERQPHGGAIWNGTPKNQVPGPGRPTSEIRARLKGILSEHGTPFVKEVLSGSVAINLREKCEHCGKEPTRESAEQILTRVPTIGDRLSAFDSTARFSIGAVKGISEEQIVERIRHTLQVVYDIGGEPGYAKALERLRAIWRLGD